MHSGCKACGLKLMLATYMNSSVPAIHVNSGVCCVGFPNWIDTTSKLVQVDPVDSLIHRQSSYLISVHFHQRSWQRIRRLQRVLGALLGQQRCSCRGPSFWRTTRKGSWDVFIACLPCFVKTTFCRGLKTSQSQSCWRNFCGFWRVYLFFFLLYTSLHYCQGEVSYTSVINACGNGQGLVGNHC